MSDVAEQEDAVAVLSKSMKRADVSYIYFVQFSTVLFLAKICRLGLNNIYHTVLNCKYR